jgi:hypothetical protein
MRFINEINRTTMALNSAPAIIIALIESFMLIIRKGDQRITEFFIDQTDEAKPSPLNATQ